MAEPKTGAERRRFSRIVFNRPALLDLKVSRCECEVHDISLKGALVEVPPGYVAKQGTTCSLVVRLDDGDARVRLDGEVAHVRGTLVGVSCDELELESAEHLRRIVEVNLGDEALLHREFAALVSERSF